MTPSARQLSTRTSWKKQGEKYEVQRAKYKASKLDLARVDINGKRLSFGDEGKVDVSVKTGRRYYLHWFVRGKPGSKYSIRITKPAFKRFRHDATLDADGMDFGRHTIQF